jgi:hypothetical protein
MIWTSWRKRTKTIDQSFFLLKEMEMFMRKLLRLFSCKFPAPIPPAIIWLIRGEQGRMKFSSNSGLIRTN